ncbi:hypothetical protein [Saccharococcus caldoxylosilyticus]|uniref:hypothetical protein n=1 Tax=Saccharococcus caldoxylosilyticus TaxID=81408 RepID=UPI0002E2B4DF|nr:hypothetical protein [Parageobacillus caldoxylosilyticus]
MKVKELIEKLQGLEQDVEVRINLLKGVRPFGTRPIKEITPVIDQDTNRLFYVIDVNVEIEYPTPEEKIIIPETDTEYK